MPNATCKIDECDRKRSARGWCHAHYMYWYEGRGEPSGPVRKWGQSRTETCSVEGCTEPYESIGYCAAHRKRVDKYGEPGPVDIRPRMVGDEADYDLVHGRLKKSRGSASAYPCVSCQGPARHWAYDHNDPNAKTDSCGLVYSLKPEHYRPMCALCHKRFDLGRLDGTRFDLFVAAIN